MKDKLTLVAVVAAISTSIGFGLSEASQPDSASAAKDPVLTELKKLNRAIGQPNLYGTTALGALEEICDSVGGSLHEC